MMANSDTQRSDASTSLPWRVHLALVIAGVTAFYAINGYSFGWWDHAIHVPYLLSRMDPAFLPGDYLLAAARSHLSFAWHILAPLSDALGISNAFFLLHLTFVTLMITGSIALARALFPRLPPLELGVILLVLVVPAQPTWAGILSMDDHLLPRGTIGILLHALALAVRGNYRRAYVLVGLMINVHATTAAHTAVLLWWHQALTTSNRRELLVAPAFLLAAAAPLMVYALRAGGVGNVPHPAPREWGEIVNLAFPFHFEIETIEPLRWSYLGIQIGCALAAWRYFRGPSIPAFMLGLATVCVVGGVAWEVFHVPFARQLHPYEATRFMHYLGMAGAAAVAIAWWRDQHGGVFRRVLVVLALLVGPLRYVVLLSIRTRMVWFKPIYMALMVVALAASILIALIPPRAQRGAPNASGHARIFVFAAAGLAGLLCTVAVAATGVRLDITGRHPANAGICNENPTEVEWRQRCGLPLMRWARTALPTQARVAIPPYFFHPLTSWRHMTRRGVIATHKEGGESNFDYAFAIEWHARMTALAGTDTLPSPRLPKDMRDWMQMSVVPYLDGYRAADDERFLTLARRFGATHAVIEKGAHLVEISMPIVYEDDAYRVHRIEK